VVNALANASGALITLALTPFLLHRLGAAEYGVWLIALSLTFSSGYLALADLGLPEAAVRFIAEARATGEISVISEVAATTTALFAAIGAVAGVLMALLAGVLVNVFHVDATLSGTARTVFMLMALTIAIELPMAGLLSVIEGAQRYGWLRAIDVVRRLAWGVIVVVAVARGHGVVSLAVSSLATTVLALVSAVVVAHRVQPGLQLRPSLVSRSTLRRTAGFGSKVAILRVLSVIYAQMDRAIVGISIGVVAVASYEVAFRIQSVAAMVLVIAGSAVIPVSAYNSARADTGRQRELFLRGTKYAVALVVPVTVATLIYAGPLINTWVGTSYHAAIWPTRLFLIYPLFGCLNQVAVPMMLGLGRVRRLIILQIISVSINLAVSIALAPHLGISGVIVGTLVGHSVVLIPYNRFFLAEFDVPWREWRTRVVHPNVIGPVLQVAVGLATMGWVVHLEQFWQVVLVWGANCGGSLAYFVLRGLRPGERSALLGRAGLPLAVGVSPKEAVVDPSTQ